MAEPLHLIVWDVDGTLVDSRRVISRAMDTAFEAVGLAAPGYEKTRAIVGLSLDVACAALAPEDFGAERLDRLVEEYKNAFIAQRAEPDFEEPLYAGALDALAALDGDGWLMAVATGKARRGLRYVFDHHPIERYFVSTHTACQGEGKPHPRMVLEALEAAGVRSEHAVVVGDTSHDMAMAANAKVRGLGVSWGFHEPHEIEAGGAHEVHHDFASLSRGLAAFRAGDHLKGAA